MNPAEDRTKHLTCRRKELIENIGLRQFFHRSGSGRQARHRFARPCYYHPASHAPTSLACLTTKMLRLPANGEEIAVPSAAHLSCPTCDEVVLRFQDSKRLGEDAIAIYRKKHGLLSADEIRAIRERFNLTQADLARLLRLGANPVSRWESARNVQTAAMDMLLRLIRDLPGSIDYLREHAARSPPRTGWGRRLRTHRDERLVSTLVETCLP